MEVPRVKPLAAFEVTGGSTKSIEPNGAAFRGPEGYRWVHLDLGDAQTKPWLKQHLPEIAARALWQSETRPRCERLADGLILNLRGVNLNPGSDPEDMVSLRMWVTKDTIVSARVRKVWAMDAIRTAADKGTAPTTVGRFLADLTHAITSRIETVSLGLEEATDEYEEAVSEGTVLPPDKLGRLRQALIKMRRFINPQREAITNLATLENWIFSPEELALLRESSNRTRRIVEELDATRDRLAALQEHIDADRVHALGRNSYLLSIVAAIFLPLGFLTGLFGVNVAGMPGVTEPLAFWFLVGASVLVGIALYLMFKLTRWF
tara:strand:+ start:125 stop:1087 length:963 start_codon:yes stop_codon:yes gene_type:complete